MRDRMERLVILPFSVGCISEASVAVGIPQPQPQPQPRRSRTDTNSPAPTTATTKGCKEEEEPESLSSESMKNSMRLLDVPKANISTGLNRLFKGFKNLSQIFGEKEDEFDDEEEMEMEIGCPTDVQHVTHIGWDGTSTATATTAINPNPMQGWDHLLSLASFSDLQSFLQPNSQPQAEAEAKASPPSPHPLHQLM